MVILALVIGAQIGGFFGFCFGDSLGGGGHRSSGRFKLSQRQAVKEIVNKQKLPVGEFLFISVWYIPPRFGYFFLAIRRFPAGDHSYFPLQFFVGLKEVGDFVQVMSVEFSISEISLMLSKRGLSA